MPGPIVWARPAGRVVRTNFERPERAKRHYRPRRPRLTPGDRGACQGRGVVGGRDHRGGAGALWPQQAGGGGGGSSSSGTAGTARQQRRQRHQGKPAPRLRLRGAPGKPEPERLRDATEARGCCIAAARASRRSSPARVQGAGILHRGVCPWRLRGRQSLRRKMPAGRAPGGPGSRHLRI